MRSIPADAGAVQETNIKQVENLYSHLDIQRLQPLAALRKGSNVTRMSTRKRNPSGTR